MFKPGHLHRANPLDLLHLPKFDIDVFYEVRRDPVEGVLMHFKVVGTIGGREFCEEFDMHRDTAFNFASPITKAVAKHGLPLNAGPIMPEHTEYDAMFEDIRLQLGARTGEPVDFDHLDKDGL
ncbi:DUF5064 family protein [Pseudomonas sp. TCU-HL1]|uniref:DUF5064 family protein n=1 Tax=Pseudomonas sp. TCU-HL1 TaxID=1856685 RepID=UPI00083D43C7|nr:DUF5064 family protein [Pseudomonas sp. TCU-HL1]AOE85201.1 acetyl-CoA carboxylase subunit alpha [Pseudomonas sp. TCU-HL1]